MIILGLTGSIGMGKSTTAQMFRDAGIPVYDADAAVHALYMPGGAAIAPIREIYPDVISKEGGIDRDKLRKTVLGHRKAMEKLEEIVHPLVSQQRILFLDTHRKNGADIVVLDIPLLFETDGAEHVDKIIVVTAPFNVQKERVLARKGMTQEAFASILAKQVPDAEKRKAADFIIDTSKGLDHARECVNTIISQLRALTSDSHQDA